MQKTKTNLAKKVFCAMCPDWEIKRPQQCSNILKRGSKTVYFCTKKCKERFSKKEIQKN